MESGVYCICCKQLISSAQAHLTFRTGFYRRYPLGICKACGPRDLKTVYQGSPCHPVQAECFTSPLAAE